MGGSVFYQQRWYWIVGRADRAGRNWHTRSVLRDHRALTERRSIVCRGTVELAINFERDIARQARDPDGVHVGAGVVP